MEHVEHLKFTFPITQLAAVPPCAPRFHPKPKDGISMCVLRYSKSGVIQSKEAICEIRANAPPLRFSLVSIFPIDNFLEYICVAHVVGSLLHHREVYQVNFSIKTSNHQIGWCQCQQALLFIIYYHRRV